MIRAVVACSLLFVATPALAQTGAASGEALFKQGMELRAAGKIGEACDAFEASEKADPNLGTLMYLGDCRETNGELTSAWAAFLAAEQRTRNATDDESVQINKAAKDRAAKLEPRLSKLTLILPPESRVEGLTITVGDEPFSSSSWNLEVPVDGKAHKIVVRAPGRTPWETTIQVGSERDHKSVKVPVLPIAAVDTPEVATRTVYVQAEERPLAIRLLPYGLATVAAGAFTGAILFERSSRAYYRDALAEPEDARQVALWDNAKEKRAKALGLAAGGLACAGVAVWLWLRPDPAASAQKTIAVQPIATPGFAGLELGGHW